MIYATIIKTNIEEFFMSNFDTNEEKHNPYNLENELRKTIHRQKKTIFQLAERNRVWKIICAVLAILLVIESIALWGNQSENEPSQQTAQLQSNVQNNFTDATINSSVDEARIDAIMAQMTLDDKIYQMLMVSREALTGYESVTAAGESTQMALAERKVGGILYNAGNFENAAQTKEMLKNTLSYAVTPVFAAVSDCGGASGMLSVLKSENSFNMPSQAVMGTYTDETQIQQEFMKNSAFIKEFGFNMNFAPFAPPASGSEMAGENSFGSDVEKTSKGVELAVKGQLAGGVISALKYFPTSSNAEKTGEQLRSCEFAAFKAGIDAGADFVLMSNGTNSALTSDGLPYCMSKTVIADLLVGELGFGGIVISNPLADSVISESYSLAEAAVNCIKAGNNMLVVSNGLDEVFAAITEAVSNGEIEQNTIDKSVKKILKIKMKRGILQ